MPLIARASLAYALGLFAVVALPPLAGALALAASLAVGVAPFVIPALGVPRSTALCAMLLGGGALVAFGELRARTGCTERLTHLPVLPIALGDDAQPGGFAHAHIEDGACSASVMLFVSEGSAHAGDVALARGALSSGDRGLVLRDAVLTEARPHAGMAALRAHVGRRIDRIFRDDAPMVRALVIADMSQIPAEQRDRFARAGLVHMLSVSGLHVAIVALALTLLASALRLPHVPSQLATLALLGAYVVLIGAPPPAVRAAVMLALVIVSRTAQRPTSKWAILAVGAVIPLMDPTTVVDLGWQLSVAGTIALVAGAALAKRMLPRKWRGARRTLATAALVSVVATIVTAPLVAWTFGQLSLVGPATNLLADPVMGVLQPVLFLALSLPIGPAERLLADAAHLLLATFDAIATHAAALPFAAPMVLPTATAALAGGVAAVAVVTACLAREWSRWLVVAVAALAVMTTEPLLHLPGSVTEVHMIDVGQGDALAIRTRRGRWIAIDAGRSWEGGDAGRRTVVPYLAHRGGEVAAFILSHPHADHVGGAASLFDALHPSLFVDPGYVGTTPPYRAALAAARRDGIPWRRVHPGDSLVVDEVVVTMLAPDSAWAASLADANLASTVALVRVGTVRVLFTGDAEGPEEEWLLANAPTALRADVLKVAHHGSRTSSTDAFVDAVHPRLALVSVGAHNSYGHPSAEIMQALRAAGATVLRTDQQGSVVVRTDGRTIEVEARGARWRVPLAPLSPP